MMKLTDILKELTEARIIDPKTWNEKTPIMDSDVIRVYHGFSGNAYKYPRVIARYGLSGKSRARRIYSYEAGNNPRGLFVSIDFEQVKRQFAGSGFIMEFHAKVSDLEAPVWNSEGGGYFVQGQFTKSFKDDDERNARRKKNQDIYRNHDNPAISQSDRPDLAFWLLEGAENQALFTGDLDPNMIRAWWVNDELINNHQHGGDWKRISRSQMVKQYPPIQYKKVGTDHSGKPYKPTYSDEYYDAEGRLFKPTDDFDVENVAKKYDIDRDEIIDIMKGMGDYELERMMWPKQIKQFRAKYGKS